MRLFAPLLALSLCLGTARIAAAKSVTILYFDNDTGDPSFDHLGKGLADMMITDLSTVPGVQVVEREKLESLLAELKLQKSKYFDPKTAQRIGKGVGAEYAVAGSFLSLSSSMRIDMRVIEIASGRILRVAKVSGQKERFFDLQQQLVHEFIDGLAVTLSTAQASKVKESLAANRVDDLATTLAYARGLDLRDRGELQSASQQMQKVMQSAPSFLLARSRYMQIMKDLYAAKATRSQALGEADTTLQAHVERRLAGMRPTPGDEESYAAYFSYRVLRGQIFLRKLANGLDRPAAAYLPYLKAYRDNQEKFAAELIEYKKTNRGKTYPSFLGRIDEGDKKLAEEIEIGDPGEYSFYSAHLVMRDLAQLLVYGRAPFFGKIEMKRNLCFHRLDPAMVPASFHLLDRALADIAANEESFKQRETIRTLQQYAKTYLVLGQPEEAIARLQTILTRYPKAEEFADTEAALKGILDGTVANLGFQPRCQPPR